eukprot:scaffold14504_cov20-Tisochrysis_lutea.AAC.2
MSWSTPSWLLLAGLVKRALGMDSKFAQASDAREEGSITSMQDVHAFRVAQMAGLVKRALEMESKFAQANDAEEEGDPDSADALREEAMAIEVCRA